MRLGAASPPSVALREPERVAAETGLAPEGWRGPGLAPMALTTVVGGLLMYALAGSLGTQALALWVVSGVGVPMWLAARRPSRLVVALARAVVLVPLGVRTAMLVSDPGTQAAAHDGGVHVTRAAAEDLLDGVDPYASDFSDDLPADWLVIGDVTGDPTPNPVVRHMPYLPASFMVAVPGVLLDRAVGVGSDPRWVMGLVIVAALVAVARRREPAWCRAATILAFGPSFVYIYGAWGTNDVVAAALVVLAALGARRHPGWSGAALALAVSYKAPLAIGLVPWTVWVVREGGWTSLRRWWTLPAVLVATCLPFLIWSPSDLWDDTVRFWAGKTEGAFPASGLGLGYRFPTLMEGPVGVVVTLGVAAVAVAAAVALVQRIDHVGMLPVATALALLGVLIPARTFQPNYLALIVGMVAPAWLVVGDRMDAPGPADRLTGGHRIRSSGPVEAGAQSPVG